MDHEEFLAQVTDRDTFVRELCSVIDAICHEYGFHYKCFCDLRSDAMPDTDKWWSREVIDWLRKELTDHEERDRA